MMINLLVFALLVHLSYSQYPNYYGGRATYGRPYGGGSPYYRQPPPQRQQQLPADDVEIDQGAKLTAAVADQGGPDQQQQILGGYRGGYQPPPNNYDSGIYPDYDAIVQQQLPPQWQQQQQQRLPQQKPVRLTTSTTTKEPELDPLSPLMVQMLNNILGKTSPGGSNRAGGLPYQRVQQQRQPPLQQPDQDVDQLAPMAFEPQGLSPFFMPNPGMRQPSQLYMPQQQVLPVRQQPLSQQQRQMPPVPVSAAVLQQMTTPVLTLAEPPQRANGVFVPGIQPSLPFVNDWGTAAGDRAPPLMFPNAFGLHPVATADNSDQLSSLPHVPADAFNTWD